MSDPLWNLLGPDDAAREERLRNVIRDFYDIVFDDAMIGFHFVGKDKKKLLELETQFAAVLLGGPLRYEGRPMREAHRSLQVLGGQFARRQQILRNVMAEHEIPQSIRDAWIDHNEKLRLQVTHDLGTTCEPPPKKGNRS